MAKSEIKIRKKPIDEMTMQRHRDYSRLLQQHHRTKRIKKMRQFFIYTFLVALVVVLLLTIVSYVLVRLERNREIKKGGTTTVMKIPILRKNNSQIYCDFNLFNEFLK